MEVVFRADASIEIGTGHVLRCLTMADTLRGRGMRTRFLCRAHPGHLASAIRSRGHDVLLLEMPSAAAQPPRTGEPAHAGWLGVPWEVDAQHALAALDGAIADWLVVDHYALDARWESAMRSACHHLMVIDDLADRTHACELLLDQNLGRSEVDYAGRVPEDCVVLAGPRFALLRSQFGELRAAGLRARPEVRHLLISMGGADKDNMTERVLDALRTCALPADAQVTVVLGGQAPWLDAVRTAATAMPWRTRVLVDVADMASLLTETDLAIGAAGTSAWERCCLGVPTLTFVIADNQRPGAHALAATGAALLVNAPEDLNASLRAVIAPGKREAMRQACLAVTDGRGTERVAEGMDHDRH